MQLEPNLAIPSSQSLIHIYFVSEINPSYNANIEDRKLDLAWNKRTMQGEI